MSVLGGHDLMQILDEKVGPELGQALRNMVEALQILDEGGAPGHIGAHLDLAIEQLREHISPSKCVPFPRSGLRSC